jgi:5-methyltetrahydrofolate--homocysteine methyltransferase
VIARALAPAAPVAKKHGITLIAKPNAGMPVTDENGNLHYTLSPADMAGYVDQLTGLGAGVFGGCCGTTPDHVGAIAQAAKASTKERAGDVEPIEDGNCVSTARRWAKIDEDAEYTAIDSDSEDDLYDMSDEADEDEILYLDLGEGAADVLIGMEGFLHNPIAVRGIESEIVKLENTLCRKVR